MHDRLVDYFFALHAKYDGINEIVSQHPRNSIGIAIAIAIAIPMPGDFPGNLC